MRNTLTALLVPVVLALAPAARADTKIAVVDFQRAGNECDEGKAANAALAKAEEEKMKPIKDKQAEFETLRADYEKQAAVLSPEAKQQKGLELQKKSDEMQQLYVQAQKDLQQKNMELIKLLGDRVRSVVREIADRDGIQLVVDQTSVVYAPDALDITNEVIRKYNSKFPAKAGAVPAATSAADPKAKPPAKPQKSGVK